MLTIVLAGLRRHPGRAAGALLSIMISVGFLVSCFTFVATEAGALRQSVTTRMANSNVVVHPFEDRDLTTLIGSVAGVALVERSTTSYVPFVAGDRGGRIELTSAPRDPRLQWAELTSGRLPTAGDEVALSGPTAAAYGLQLGQQLTIRQDRITTTVRVVGITREPRSVFAELTPTGLVAPGSPALRQGSSEYLIIAAAGTSPDTLATTLRARIPQATTETATERADQQLAALTDGVDTTGYLLTGFGGVAMLVGAMIMATTFAVSVAQRRRQIGLLRAIGAGRGQIRVQVLIEALVTGAVGSVAGLLLGVGVAALGASITGSLASGLVLQPLPLVVSVAVGVVVTVLAALLPAGQAVRVSPLEALRPVADGPERRRSIRLRGALAGAAMIIGALVVAGGMLTGQQTLLTAVAGSALIAVGILALTPVYLPVLLSIMARLLAHRGPTVRLAAAQLVRHPARAATVCTALMLGVGLIVTLQVGAASVKASAEASLRGNFPIDLTVSTWDQPVPAGLATAVRSLPGVEAAIEVPSVEVDLAAADGSYPARVYGLDGRAGSAVAAGLDQLADGVALVHPYTMQSRGLADGDTVRLGYRGRQITVRLRASDVAAEGGSFVLTRATLAQLAPKAPVTAVWAAARDDVDVIAVAGGAEQIAARSGDLSVGGSLQDVAAITRVLEALLTIATALTAVAVAIAFVGMGTTLGLSVIERARESALLRALGVQRSQLRAMLAIEAVLLALVGAAVGIVAGTAFGMLGAFAMTRAAEFDVITMDVSVGATAVVVLGSVAAGALASVLPGRRAAQAAPVAALAIAD